MWSPSFSSVHCSFGASHTDEIPAFLSLAREAERWHAKWAFDSWWDPKHKKSSPLFPQRSLKGTFLCVRQFATSALVVRTGFRFLGWRPPKNGANTEERLFEGDIGGESERDVSAGCTWSRIWAFERDQKGTLLCHVHLRRCRRVRWVWGSVLALGKVGPISLPGRNGLHQDWLGTTCVCAPLVNDTE